jgi:hypothetical protein
MKSKKGGNKNGKKGGKKKGGGGKKPPQQPPRDVEVGFVLPKAEMGLIPGFGYMVTKSWYEAYHKGHYPLMIEIARRNMQVYWNKVTDAQSKASLLHMLGYSLERTCEREAVLEGRNHDLEAMELIRSLDERTAHEIVFGVWPESCISDWDHFILQRDPSERNGEMEWIQEMINLTRRTINSELERFAYDSQSLKMLRGVSHVLYQAELAAISGLSLCFVLLSLNVMERWLAIFGRRMEEIETVNEQEGGDLTSHL